MILLVLISDHNSEGWKETPSQVGSNKKQKPVLKSALCQPEVHALWQDSAVEAADFQAAVSCKVSLRCGYCHAQVSANSVQSAGHQAATNPSCAEFPSQKVPVQRCVFCLGRPEFIWHMPPASFLQNEISTRAT